jgi:hypothetical protein
MRQTQTHLSEAFFCWGEVVPIPNARFPGYKVLGDVHLIQSVPASR